MRRMEHPAAVVTILAAIITTIIITTARATIMKVGVGEEGGEVVEAVFAEDFADVDAEAVLEMMGVEGLQRVHRPLPRHLPG